MEFLSEDAVPPPQEADLRAYLRAHPEKFRTQPLISLRQVFVSQTRGASAEADAGRILTRLAGGTPDAANEGDPLLLGDGFSRTPLDRIAALFGESFAQAVAQAMPGGWVGPLRSAYGLHLVLVTAVEPAELPPFEQVRSAVEREWFAERRAAAQVAQYQALLAGYRVIVQKPPAALR
jgi:PPIC-type PPIASE domain